MWSAEHGPDRDDEVNVEVAGGNYGWNPVPGYDEAVPMTDPALGTVVGARWSASGRAQCQSLMATSSGEGEPVPVSTRALRLNRYTAHLVLQW